MVWDDNPSKRSGDIEPYHSATRADFNTSYCSCAAFASFRTTATSPSVARHGMAEKVGKQETLSIGWPVSLLWATVIVGVSIALSATINPLFDRYVHWDWMAVIAPLTFTLLLLAFRRRWIYFWIFRISGKPINTIAPSI